MAGQPCARTALADTEARLRHDRTPARDARTWAARAACASSRKTSNDTEAPSGDTHVQLTLQPLAAPAGAHESQAPMRCREGAARAPNEATASTAAASADVAAQHRAADAAMAAHVGNKRAAAAEELATCPRKRVKCATNV